MSNSAPPVKPSSDLLYEIKSLVVALLGFKLLVLAFICLIGANFPGAYDTDRRLEFVPEGLLPTTPGLTQLFDTWDTQYYLAIAEQGYRAHPKLPAFYPLWPLTVRFVQAITGMDFLPVALLLSNLFSLVAFVVLYRLLRAQFDQPCADRTLLLMLAFPGAFYFCLAYTESLFLLLLVGLCAALHWRLRYVALLCAFLLPLTRAVGICAVLPLIVWYTTTKANERSSAVVLAPLVGYLSYLGIMWWIVGDPVAGVVAQEHFGFRSTIGKLLDPTTFFYEAFGRSLNLHDGGPSGFEHVWLMFFAWGSVQLWRVHPFYFWLALPMGFIPAVTLSLTAFTRFLAVLFPLFLVLSLSFVRPTRRIWYALTIAAFAIIQFFFLLRHINFQWVA